MSTATHTASDRRLLTIGAVCARLQEEFADISISKIRYLGDQGLVTPRRTRGGYRLFSEEDVELLETILRLQRDEFMPLRVIRQQLSSGAAGERRRRRGPSSRRERARGGSGRALRTRRDHARAGARLEEYGLLTPRIEAGSGSIARATPTSPRPAAGWHASESMPATCARSGTPRGARRRCSSNSSRPRSGRGNPERRKAGLDDLQALAEATQGALVASSSGATCGTPRSGRLRTWHLDLTSRSGTSRTSRRRGSSTKDLMPLIADPIYFKETVDRLAEWAGPKHPDPSSAPRRAASSSGPRSHMSSEQGSSPRASRGSFLGDDPGHVRARVRHRHARVQADSIGPGSRVIVLDDVLATGGTAKAKCGLVETLGGEIVGVGFVVELTFLHIGRDRLAGYDIHSLIAY